MKRSFPQATLEAIGLLGLAGLLVLPAEGCSPNNSVPPGAPVLTQLTILETGATPTNITGTTTDCTGAPKTGDMCRLADNVVEGVVVDKADQTCRVGNSTWCRCVGMDTGMWDCDPFAPLSVVIATFDRIIDTDPIDPGDAASRSDIATIMSLPPPPSTVTTATDYSSTGSAQGVVFNVYGPAYFGNFRSSGPSLQVIAEPAMPTGAAVTIALLKDKVLAKDGHTQFTGPGLLADGTIAFETAPFAAQITVPTAPPPDASADAGADASDADASDAGADAEDSAADAPVDAGVDAGAVDAGAPEVAADDAANEAGTADAMANADAGPPPPPEPGAPVPASLNTTPVTISFNNLVDATAIEAFITITEDGQSFTAFKIDSSKAPTFSITPNTAWAAGKTYVVQVDKKAADVVGDTLGMFQLMSFVMAN